MINTPVAIEGGYSIDGGQNWGILAITRLQPLSVRP